MASTLSDISALNPGIALRLRSLGIRTPRALVAAGRSGEARCALARSLGAPPERVLEWVQAAELFTVRGIGARYGRLLEAVGIASVPALRVQDGRQLAARMAAKNAELELCRNTPDPLTVSLWIEQAKLLDSPIQL